MTLADLDNWRELLQTIQGAVELIQSLYPVKDELVVPTSTLEHLHAVVNGQADISDIKDDSLSLRLRVEVDPDHVVEVRIAFSLRPSVDDAAPSSIPTLTLLQPAWLSNSPFHVLAEQLEADTNPVEEEPTALLLDFVARLQKLALTFLPANSVASTGYSFEGSIDDLSLSTDGLSLQDSMSNLLCVSKMHRSFPSSLPPFILEQETDVLLALLVCRHSQHVQIPKTQELCTHTRCKRLRQSGSPWHPAVRSREQGRARQVSRYGTE